MTVTASGAQARAGTHTYVGEWIDYGRPWASYERDTSQTDVEGHASLKASGFTIDFPDSAGMEIELESGERHLIGSINCAGGLCDCCSPISSCDVIVRYRRIWQAE